MIKAARLRVIKSVLLWLSLDGANTDNMVTIEPVTGVAIAVLGAVFVGSLVILVVLCRHKYCKPLDLISRQHQVNNPDQHLVENIEVEPAEHPAAGVELNHVGFNCIDDVLQNEEWVEDATGLAPHCLAILRTCHQLSERLVGMTMQGNNHQLCSPETITDLVATAKRIGPRVDEVVRALYPPLDPRLLEARCTALVLSVSHLVLITKNACRLSGVLDWIDQSLADVEDHLRVLREASVNFDQNTVLFAQQQNAGALPPQHHPANENPQLFINPSNHNSPQHSVQISPQRNDEARL